MEVKIALGFLGLGISLGYSICAIVTNRTAFKIDYWLVLSLAIISSTILSLT